MSTMSIDPALTETTLFDDLIKYGLFLGAIFQMICIGAVIFVPKKDDGKDAESSDEDGSEQGSPHSSHRCHGPHQTHHRRKHDKKKRR